MENKNYYKDNKKAETQFFVKKTNKNLIEISADAFDFNQKIRVGFRFFKVTAEKGNRTQSSINFYFAMDEFDLLCNDILSGKISRTIIANEENAKKTGKYPKAAYEAFGGSIKNMEARIFQITSGSRTPNVIKAFSGPGKISEKTNGIVADGAEIATESGIWYATREQIQ